MQKRSKEYKRIKRQWWKSSVGIAPPSTLPVWSQGEKQIVKNYMDWDENIFGPAARKAFFHLSHGVRKDVLLCFCKLPINSCPSQKGHSFCCFSKTGETSQWQAWQTLDWSPSQSTELKEQTQEQKVKLPLGRGTLRGEDLRWFLTWDGARMRQVFCWSSLAMCSI